ncbi:uncharacterized protein [Hoplias malabaricus]|uniref:uncharacterized protein n=1 Tax=Hoplias malabaricus TaxID=27720 RepID=UPI0034627CD8
MEENSVVRSQNRRCSHRKNAGRSQRFEDYLVDLGKPKPKKLARRYITNMAFVDDTIYPFSYAEIMYKGKTFESADPRSMEGLYGPNPSESVSGPDEPLLIHGHNVSDYQSVYRSVVEPMLKTKAGEQRCYSLDMGRKIKHKLWETLFCSKSSDISQSEGETSSPAVNCRPPDIEVDISREPMPPKPERNMVQKSMKRKWSC